MIEWMADFRQNLVKERFGRLSAGSPVTSTLSSALHNRKTQEGLEAVVVESSGDVVFLPFAATLRFLFGPSLSAATRFFWPSAELSRGREGW